MWLHKQMRPHGREKNRNVLALWSRLITNYTAALQICNPCSFIMWLHNELCCRIVPSCNRIIILFYVDFIRSTLTLIAKNFDPSPFSTISYCNLSPPLLAASFSHSVPMSCSFCCVVLWLLLLRRPLRVQRATSSSCYFILSSC